MSKRFGRNQRRRLRAELAQNNAAWALDQQLIRWQRGVIDRQDGSLRHVAALLGRHFIGLEPHTVDMEELPREVRIHRQESLLRNIGSTTLCELTDMSLHRIQDQALSCTHVQAALDEMTLRTHLKVSTPLGEVAYAFAPGAFRDMPRREVVQQLARQLAECLYTSAAARAVL